MTAKLTKWYEEHGRHEIFGAGRDVPLDSTEHTLTVNPEAVVTIAQTDLDELGIPKNTREEEVRARAEGDRLRTDRDRIGGLLDSSQHAEMERLYRQHVLKQQPMVQIQSARRSI